MKRLTLDFLDGSSADAERLARLHAKEWQHLYREWDEKKALEDFRSQKTDGSIPATLVLREDGRLVGSVSVVHDDCEVRRDLGPWLASLYVMQKDRGQGHGRRLLEAAIALAKQNNAGCLHVFTESAEQLFLHHGFTRFAAAATNGRAITILRREI
ncbi:MAG: GNAT family N-acetyltransferase [Chthoniobacterales bacterium]